MNNWNEVRGKKVDNRQTTSKIIDFDKIYKRILIVVDKELSRTILNKEELVLPNKCASWVIN